MSDTDKNATSPGGQTGDNGSANGTGDTKKQADTNGGNEGGENKNPPPETIPYSRFSEEVSKRKALEERLSKMESDSTTARQKALEENKKFEDLYNESKPHVERAKALEAVVTRSVDELMTKIPEDKRSLIPESLTPEAKLDYIHKNYDFLTAAAGGKTIGHGTNPGGDTTSTKTFTAEQLKDPKFYAENRDEILKAQREGRIKD